jgi:hypothetical protein
MQRYADLDRLVAVIDAAFQRGREEITFPATDDAERNQIRRAVRRLDDRGSDVGCRAVKGGAMLVFRAFRPARLIGIGNGPEPWMFCDRAS